ncbi:hypothetical protein GCM10011506_45620 [Marivirga lumbricoides]|uniref:DUF4293 domain-containing protein n=1 Tax=Marivirga lumbricoides TaxID=1046115 RepID=A0ABQ1N5N8_9BACT|nr:hypothetical protein GCM10011506_45620 [Marivirga lumbricoides]
MKRQIEVRWVIFLFTILIAAFGLLTGFAFGDTFNIQLHDTYYVIESLYLLVILIITLSIAYLLTLGLKRLALLNRILKTTSIIIIALIGLSLFGLLALIIGTFAMSPAFGQSLSSYGITILVLGMTILFMMRTKEIWRKN